LTTRPHHVGVVVPALNEAKTVGGVVREILAAVPGATVVVVDDGSTDGTGAVAAAAGADVVTHAVSTGYATALRDGFAAAIAAGADRLVQLDADGQHRPQDIPDLLAALDTHELVIGSRFAGVGYSMDAPRRIGIALCQALVRACGLRISDPTSGLRAMHASESDSMHDGFEGIVHFTRIVRASARAAIRRGRR
jgi:glycosyltransferase involved in cell wall biosynthesis